MWLTYDYWLLSNIISLFPCIPSWAHLYLLQTHQVSPLRVGPFPLTPHLHGVCHPRVAGGVQAQSGPVSLLAEGFHWRAPHVQGCRAIGWSPAGQRLLPFLDWCTWSLNWGKPQDVLFTLLYSGIVNFQMQGKCFCSGEYNAKYKGGLVWLKRPISELIQTINTPWSFIIFNFCCEQSIAILVWSIDRQSAKHHLNF